MSDDERKILAILKEMNRLLNTLTPAQKDKALTILAFL